MSTHKRWWFALPLAAAAVTVAPTAHADPGFGLVPEFKFGPNFGSVPGTDAAGKPSTTGSSAWLFEGDFDASHEGAWGDPGASSGLHAAPC